MEKKKKLHIIRNDYLGCVRLNHCMNLTSHDVGPCNLYENRTERNDIDKGASVRPTCLPVMWFIGKYRILI